MRRYSLIEDAQENNGFGNGYERFEEQEMLPGPEDHKSMLRVLLREADAAKQMTLDELRAKIGAILPGAAFEVDDLGQIVIRSGFRVNIDSEAWSEILRQKAREQFPPRRDRSRKKN